MTTRVTLRKAALGLPEVEEGTHFGMPEFTVGASALAAPLAEVVRGSVPAASELPAGIGKPATGRCSRPA